MFGVLLVVLLVYILIPVFREVHPSLAQIELNLDPSVVGLAALLVFMSFALILIEKIPPSSYLSKLRLSASGVEAVFKELRQIASEIEEREVTPEVRDEIAEIRESDRDPRAVFLELIIEIEKKLRVLATRSGIQSWKYISIHKLVELLIASEIIDRRLANLIRSFWYLRNKVIHGEIDITRARLDEAIYIGETILSKLEKAYTKSQ